MVVIDVHVQNSRSDPASVEDAARWATTYGLSFPVLADVEGTWADEWGPEGRYSQRIYMVLGSDGHITWVQSDGDPGSAAEVIAELEAAR